MYILELRKTYYEILSIFWQHLESGLWKVINYFIDKSHSLRFGQKYTNVSVTWSREQFNLDQFTRRFYQLNHLKTSISLLYPKKKLGVIFFKLLNCDSIP